MSAYTSGGLHLIPEGVGVREEQSGSITVPALDVVVVKFVHEMLTELEDGEAGVDGAVQCQHRLQHVDGDHRLEDGVVGAVEHQLRLREMDGHHAVEDPEGVEPGLGELLEDGLLVAHQLHVRALPEILHRFRERRVVH